MPKPLVFKGDKKPKKRKRRDKGEEEDEESHSKVLALAGDAKADEDDTWVTADTSTDVTGPVLLVLPSSPAACVACDANGIVFTSEIENMIEGDPATAEPHDVRQVWIATRFAGSEYTNFKNNYGRYLACDKFGFLSATREAASNEENFLCIASSEDPGTFNLRTERELFVTVKEGKKGLEARFKPRLKASKAEKAREKISRLQLESDAGRPLGEDEIKRLKRARRDGYYNEALLDVKTKSKHDKYA